MKHIIIIGASSGIGRRIALDFARFGWQVGIAARRLDRLEEIRSQYPGNVVCARIDAASPDAPAQFLELISRNGGADTILYAAGTGWSNPDLDLEPDIKTISANVEGFTRIINTAFRYYRDTPRADRGQIAAITSIAATKGLGVSAAYSASKSYQQIYLQALDQLARLKKVPVDITDIRPGFIRTPLLRPDQHYPMLMTLDYAVPRIELALLRRRRVATIDWRWSAVTRLWRLIPGAIWPVLPVKL